MEIFKKEKEAQKYFKDGILDEFRTMFHQGLPLDVELWLLSKESFERGALDKFRHKFPNIPNVVANVNIGQDCLVLKSMEPRLSPGNLNHISFFRDRIAIWIGTTYWPHFIPTLAKSLNEQKLTAEEKAMVWARFGLTAADLLGRELSEDDFVQATVRIAKELDRNIIALKYTDL